MRILINKDKELADWYLIDRGAFAAGWLVYWHANAILALPHWQPTTVTEGIYWAYMETGCYGLIG